MGGPKDAMHFSPRLKHETVQQSEVLTTHYLRTLSSDVCKSHKLLWAEGVGTHGPHVQQCPRFYAQFGEKYCHQILPEVQKKCRQSAELWNGRVSVQIGGYFCGAGVQTTNRVIM